LNWSHHQNCVQRNLDVIRKADEDPLVSTIILSAFWSSYAFEKGDLEAVIRRLPNKRLVVLDDLPIPGFNVPWAVALHKRVSTISPPQPIAALDLSDLYPNVYAIRLEDAFCSEDKCPIQIGGHLLYADADHVSEYAARKILGPYLENKLRRLWPDQLAR
jgi:hypothetical protein